jgi:hypothetical protein
MIGAGQFSPPSLYSPFTVKQSAKGNEFKLQSHGLLHAAKRLSVTPLSSNLERQVLHRNGL